MSTHLVLVVHGIGEQMPGQTVGQVVASAVAAHEDRPGDDLADVPVTVTASEIMLTEADFTEMGANGGRAAKAEVFPVRTFTATPIDGSDRRTVFAEVYWSDLSVAPQGPIGTIAGLLRLILGLGYLAMDNVENTKTAPYWRVFHRGVVHLFNWIFYGAIAVLNVALLIGAAALVLRQWLSGIPYSALLAIDLVGVFVLWAILALRERTNRSRQNFLFTVFRVGLFFWWVLAGALLVAVAAMPGALVGALRWAAGSLPAAVWAESVGCRALVEPVTGDGSDLGFAAVSCFVEINIAALGLAWMLAALLSMVALSGYLRSRGEVIYPAVCAAMLLFWSVLASGFWLALQQLMDGLDPALDDCRPSAVALHGSEVHGLASAHDGTLAYRIFCDHLDTALSTLTMSVLYLFPLGVVAGWAFWRGQRLLLNDGVQAVLAVYPLAMVAGAVLSRQSSELAVSGVLRAFEPYTAAVALMIALGVYYFADVVAAGLGIIRDIVTYAVRRQCRWLDPPEGREGNYPERKRIDNRFARVFTHMVRAGCPDRITVLSHSQGTVIAARELKRILASDGPCAGMGERVTLITMGSPISHVYRQYFPLDFDIRREGIAEGLRWVNIYRSGDFVGTRVDGAGLGEADNVLAGPGGHTSYFVDAGVWARLWREGGFRLFPEAG